MRNALEAVRWCLTALGAEVNPIPVQDLEDQEVERELAYERARADRLTRLLGAC